MKFTAQVGVHRQLGNPEGDFVDDFCQWELGMPDKGCMESRRYRQRNDLKAVGFESLSRGLYLRGWPRDDDLGCRVVIGDDYTLEPFQMLGNFFGLANHCKHRSGVETRPGLTGHRLTTGVGNVPVVVIRQHSGSPKCRPLAETMSGSKIRCESRLAKSLI